MELTSQVLTGSLPGRITVYPGPRGGVEQMSGPGGSSRFGSQLPAPVCLGEVAEWQTRTVQVRVPERA